jgi:enolase
MRTVQQLLLALAAAASIAAASGCIALAAGAAAGAGTYAYLQGDMKTTFEAPLDRVWAATERAIHHFEFQVESARKDALQGRMTVHQADGTPIRIALDRQTHALTDASVRVGVFGNEAKSRLILNRIRDNLEQQH